MKAKPKTGRDAVGECITHPEHGTAYLLQPGGRLWCPHQSHDMPEGGSAWLETQANPPKSEPESVEATA